MALVLKRYIHIQVASGDPSSLASGVQQAEHGVEEGSNVELQLNFHMVFPLFEETANGLNATLKFAGVEPWPGNDRLVYADPDKKSYFIRWRKGFEWASIIVSALWALAIIFVALLLWKFFKVVLMPLFQQYPWLAPVLIVAGLLIMIPSPKEAGVGAG